MLFAFFAGAMHIAGRGLCDGRHPFHMCCKQLAKVFGIAREHTPLVPYNSEGIPNWSPLVAYTNNTQGVAINSYG
jgi:hypothetical protein